MHKSTDIPSCNDCKKRGGSIFCNLVDHDLTELSTSKKHKNFKKGEDIFLEGNRPFGLFCIYEGKVKIHKLGEGGKEQIVRFAKEGDLIGYRSLLSDESYSATATAFENTKLCYLPKSEFMSLLQRNNAFSMETIRLLAEDLKNAENKITNMAQKGGKERIAEVLLHLKEYYGLQNDGQTINAKLTRREIGSVAGVTTETTIRTLSDFNDQGIIRIEGKKILITQPAELTRIANILD